MNLKWSIGSAAVVCLLQGVIAANDPSGQPDTMWTYKHIDGKELQLSVFLPDADESICGFGLQLDGIKKTSKVLTLNVDHWARGGGRTHAIVCERGCGDSDAYKGCGKQAGCLRTSTGDSALRKNRRFVRTV